MASSGEDDCLPAISNDIASNPRGRKRKSRGSGGNSVRRRGVNQPSAAPQRRAAAPSSRAKKTASRAGTRGRPRRTPPVASRPVANLETSVGVLLLCSSDDDDQSSLSGHSSPVTDAEGSKENRTDYANTSHNEQNAGVSEKNIKLSDDENEENQENCTPLAGFDPNVTFSDSDSEDLYSVNHNEIKASAQEAAMRGLHKAQQQQQQHVAVPHASAATSPHGEIEIGDSDDDDYRCPSPVPATPPSPEVSSIKLSARKMVKMSKRTLQLLAKADKIGKTMDLDLDQSINKSSGDIDLLFMTQTDSNPLITMTLKQGLSTFSKIQIKKLDKFGSVYQQMAELHGVRFENVVLSLRDSILSPDQTPADVGLTVADIVECGIIRRSCKDGGEAPSQAAPDDENTITLKFQCSQMRGSLTLHINKFEKMAAVMQTYAQKKGEPVNKFRFMFDGEKLDPDETPTTLDLEGGECIDVFPA